MQTLRGRTPYFEQLHQSYQNEKLQVILVSLDFERDIERKLIPFLEKYQLKSDVVLLLDGRYNEWIDKVSSDWGGAIPATVIYNAKEKRFIGDQFANYDELYSLVSELL